MPDISTKFVGPALRSPIIVGSAGIAKDAERIQRAEENGTGTAVIRPRRRTCGYGGASQRHFGESNAFFDQV